MGWGQGFNHGKVGRILSPLLEKIRLEAKVHNKPIILIGWSLGGIIAREIARQAPEKVLAVCCMGSPIIGGPQFTIYARLYQKIGFDLSETAATIQKREKNAIAVPSHVMYSKKDGIVHWEACIDTNNMHTTHKEIQAPHFSMGSSLEVYKELVRWIKTILPASP